MRYIRSFIELQGQGEGGGAGGFLIKNTIIKKVCYQVRYGVILVHCTI